MRVLGGVDGAGDSLGVVEVKACVDGDCTSDAFGGKDDATLLVDDRGLPPNADMKERTAHCSVRAPEFLIRAYLYYDPL